MADHWGFVGAAYLLGLVVLAGYWRRLCRQERRLDALVARRTRGRPR